MTATISTILRAVIFLCVSNTQFTLSEPAPGWQSEQSKPSAAVITPIASMKSATGRTLSVLVLTALKSAPAVWPGCALYFGCGGMVCPVCPAAGLANAALISNATVVADQGLVQPVLER